MALPSLSQVDEGLNMVDKLFNIYARYQPYIEPTKNLTTAGTVPPLIKPTTPTTAPVTTAGLSIGIIAVLVVIAYFIFRG